MTDPVWTDGVTPLDSAHMTKLQTRDEKAAVNGYPSLDAGGKVPAAQLPDLSAAYQAKSEKAVASGYAGLDSSAKVPMAQLWTDTTNALLTLDASGRVRTAQLRTTYSVTPPSSPVDGDLWVLPADATNGIMWTFRYRPASPHAYKWEFVGGLALRSEDSAAAGPIGNAFVALGTPTLVAPRTGHYDVTLFTPQVQSAVITSAQAGVGVNGSNTMVTAGAISSNDLNAAYFFAMGPSSGRVALNAGDSVNPVVHGGAGGATWNARSMLLLPQRVI